MIISSVDKVPLEKCPALVLNADFRPLSYYPLSIWCWQDAVKSVFLDRVSIVSNYKRKSFIQPSKNPNFTRFNVFLRDKFSCQYCGDKKDLTFDHLLPKSRGGLTDWNNVVTACSSCNVRKGGKLYKDCDLKLANTPYAPTVEDLHRNGRNFHPNFLHESWMDYLYWDIELQP